MRRAFIMVAAMIACGCASAAPSFTVYGTRGDLEQLVGRWTGEYLGSPEHGRRGSIAFDLAAGSDHAHGTVLMIPHGATRPYGRFEPGRPDQTHSLTQDVAPDELLTIQFAWVARGQVEGVLDSYWDSDRATAASTTFRGRADGGRIDGTFVTQYANRAPDASGTWSVTRR